MLFAFLVMVETWVDNCKSFDIITPRYLALSTSCRACPLMVFIFCKTVFFLEIRTTSHFAALNDRLLDNSRTNQLADKTTRTNSTQHKWYTAVFSEYGVLWIGEACTQRN